MNFCNEYNKIMNWLEYLDHKYISDYNEGMMLVSKRTNSTEINIILGTIWLIICVPFICFIFALGYPIKYLIIYCLIYPTCKLYYYIKNVTTSKCN